MNFDGFYTFYKRTRRRVFVALCVGFISLGLLSGCVSPAWSDGPDPEGSSAKQGSQKTQKSKDAGKKADAKNAQKTQGSAKAAKKTPAKQGASGASQQTQKGSQQAAGGMTEDSWKQGCALVTQGELQAGIAYLNNYVKRYPRSAEAWYCLSRAYHARGDYDRSQQAANIALAIDPDFERLTKSPSGLQPIPHLTKDAKKVARKSPPQSMSVLPVKPYLPAGLELRPAPFGLPYLPASGDPKAKQYYGTDRNGVREYTDGLVWRPYPPVEEGKVPAWMQNERFHEISRWRNYVDRMGMLDYPRVPVAWRGEHPYVFFVWLGDEWARVNVNIQARERVSRLLARAGEDIVNYLRKTGYVWNENDTPAMAAASAHWRYSWQGEIRADYSKPRKGPFQGSGLVDATGNGTIERKKTPPPASDDMGAGGATSTTTFTIDDSNAPSGPPQYTPPEPEVQWQDAKAPTQ